jgi:hypothetical protein
MNTFQTDAARAANNGTAYGPPSSDWGKEYKYFLSEKFYGILIWFLIKTCAC